MQSWSHYIQTVDNNLLTKIYELNNVVIPYKKIKDFISKYIPNQIHQSSILSNDVISQIISKSDYYFFNGQSLKNDRNKFNKIKNKLRKERENGIYHRQKFNKNKSNPLALLNYFP